MLPSDIAVPLSLFDLLLLIAVAVLVLYVLLIEPLAKRHVGAATRWELVRFVGKEVHRVRSRNEGEIQRNIARRIRPLKWDMAMGHQAMRAIEILLSPEDLAVIEVSVGLRAAARSLEDWYLLHARDEGWAVHEDGCRIVLRKDMALSPRQIRARAAITASPGPHR